jgi:hypothetical protein
MPTDLREAQADALEFAAAQGIPMPIVPPQYDTITKGAILRHIAKELAKIDLAKWLSPADEAEQLSPNISDCRADLVESVSQQDQFMSTIKETLEDKHGETSVEIVSRKKEQFICFKGDLSESFISPLDKLSSSEAESCRNRNDLIMKHHLEMKKIDPTNGKQVDDF